MADLFIGLAPFALGLLFYAAFCAGEYLYRRLTQHSHGDRPDSDRAIVGDVPFVPADLEPFHSATYTQGGQPDNGA
jgi:hypothetical protein